MMKTLFIQPTDYRRGNHADIRPALTRVWIETGNPRQPLACVWIDPRVRLAGDDNSESEPAPPEVWLACA